MRQFPHPLVLSLLTVAFLHVDAAGFDQGTDLMMRSLKGEFSCNFKATISQLDPKSDFYQTIEVLRSRTGKIRHTVLSPDSVKGFCTIDDGDKAYLYDPVRNILIEQGASDMRPKDLLLRTELSRQNYDFRTEGQALVAGRTTWCVVASPKVPLLATRRYYLDAKTAYPLRLETLGRMDTPSVRFDTREIQFGYPVSNQSFSPSMFGAVIRVHARPPSATNASQAKRILGFTPIVPKRIALGFALQQMQILEDPQFHALVLRLTDGLTRATVYQWKLSSNASNLNSMERSSGTTLHGIRILVLSDALEKVREKILGSFIGEYSRKSARN